MRELTELYYFSPTGGTKKAGMLLCEGISWDIEAVDLGKKKEEPRQPKGDLVVAAMPPPMQAMMDEKLGAFRAVRGANELFGG